MKYLIYTLICLLIFTGCDDEIAPKDNYKEEPPDFAIIDYNPAWSPDGQWIAFYHADTIPDNSGIYFISPDGEKIKRWHERFGQYPAWSPDGQWIAFYQNHQIWKKKVNGDSIAQLTFEGRNYHPSWSPDGKWIAYDSNVDSENGGYFIWIIGYDSFSKKRIKYTPGEGAWRMPDWGSNHTIVYQKYVIESDFPEIFLMDSTGNNVRRITYNEATDSYPKLSGSKIAYTFKSPDNILFQICTINTDGTGFKQLTRGYTCDWSPDGKQIVYTDSRSENGRLWVMDADGSNKKQLTFKYQF
ncbi:MAG: DPP IV N-terminal domain-containing protein [Bacteroidota bacterium]|nr:DPP IV N-terminal domain-containing protein [Bacteroidota bacterium]